MLNSEVILETGCRRWREIKVRKAVEVPGGEGLNAGQKYQSSMS